MPVDTQPVSMASTALREEGVLLALYLLGGREPPLAALERYESACATLFNAPHPPEDPAVLGFLRRHPWSLPFLDAAAALFHPHALLRKKLLLMLAILETMPLSTAPGGVDLFSPRPGPRVLVIAKLAFWGASSAFKASVGAIIFAVSRRAS